MAGVAFAAATHTGLSLAVAVLILWGYIIRRALASVRRIRVADDGRLSPAPLYLILVPCFLVLARLMFLPSAVEFGRKRAIAGSARFISAIEGYRAPHGHYPASLASSITTTTRLRSVSSGTITSRTARRTTCSSSNLRSQLARWSS